MTQNRPLAAGPVAPATPVQISARPAPAAPDGRAPRPVPLTRRYETCWLAADGRIDSATRLGPAVPLFEEAFSALARGAVIATGDGPVAVEDLVPGVRALTAEGRAETITWIGSMVLYPDATTDAASGPIRVTAGAFGQGRPMSDLVLGPAARLCLRGGRLTRATGLEAAYVPVRALVDGETVIALRPAMPVTVYHLVLARQGSLRVAGVEVESYHPGGGLETMVEPRMLSLFLAQFPQLRGLADFGPPALPRLTSAAAGALWG
ncbi:type I secretion protein [Sinirhodobacter hankyongi]|uniref:Type I secretion protein n=1 Tax=Paenirhodobacter hankyongi TaxID=2294033 RepID=A0A421BX79_9RHOB|nr:type I secretion protein [Sinirhodobacter hankyongi]